MRAESNLASLSLSVSAPTEEMMPVMSYETLTASSLVLAELTSNKSELVQLSGSIHHIAGRAYKRITFVSRHHNVITGPDALGNLTDSDGEALPPSWASRYAATCFISFWTGERRKVSDASWCVVQCDGKGGHADSLRRRV